MNTQCFDAMLEVPNKYNIELDEGEKVIFVSNLTVFGDENDQRIGNECDITLTNRKIVVDNHAGTWTIDIANDVTAFRKVTGGFWIFKYKYIAVDLNQTVVYDNYRGRLNGYHLYFDDSELERFETIIKPLMS